ncbi:MAG: hypothetical protein ACREXY_02675 [Gammaproteobacteria bacterium]
MNEPIEVRVTRSGTRLLFEIPKGLQILRLYAHEGEIRAEVFLEGNPGRVVHKTLSELKDLYGPRAGTDKVSAYR